MSARAWRGRRAKPRSLGHLLDVSIRHADRHGAMVLWISDGRLIPPRRADLARIRRVETLQRRLDRRYDRHERHRTCPRGTLAVTITADVSQFMEALGIALEAWQEHMLERALVGTDAVTQPLRGLL